MTCRSLAGLMSHLRRHQRHRNDPLWNAHLRVMEFWEWFYSVSSQSPLCINEVSCIHIRKHWMRHCYIASCSHYEQLHCRRSFVSWMSVVDQLKPQVEIINRIYWKKNVGWFYRCRNCPTPFFILYLYKKINVVAIF